MLRRAGRGTTSFDREIRFEQELGRGFVAEPEAAVAS
jgi:hypothetical protein